MKFMIFCGITIFGSIGSAIGNLIDFGHVDLFDFGLWTAILSTVGSFVGIWVGYKAGQYFGE
jgi:hypothetical protein